MNRRLPLLAGLAVALVGGPAGWMMVNAQSAGGLTAQDTSQATATAGSNQSSTSAATRGGSNSPSVSKASAAASSKTSQTAKDTKPAGNAAGASSTNASNSNKTTTPAALSPAAGAAVTPGQVTNNGWHDNIITTIFWVGEAADANNANISNTESAWDGNWQTHYGGFDDPDHRSGYYPASFTPHENPFYFALPYNDLDPSDHRKASAASCPNAGSSTVSWCKNAWIKVTKGSKTAYAQWQDVGPLEEDDSAYVFGTARPKNTWGAKAGLDVSPAMRDYLGLQDVDRTGWSFVNAESVPAGPWKTIVTASPGGW